MLKEHIFEGQAFSTNYILSFITANPDSAQRAADWSIKQIKRYENIFSRFLVGSELSLLNQYKTYQVSEEFMAVIKSAYGLYQKTQHNFNPLLQVSALGYFKSFKELSLGTDNQTNGDTNYNTDFDSVQIDEDSRSITLKGNQMLDFGGLLKGYLSDFCIQHIKENFKEMTGAIINLGGDISTFGQDNNGEDFIFSVYNPILDIDIENIRLRDQSLATSGTYKRQWKNGGLITNHIVDNTTRSNPKNNLVSVSIIHDNGSDAEAFTKIFLTQGVKKSLEILTTEKFNYLVIDNKGEIITNIKNL